MQVSVHEAEGQLSELMSLAEAGREVILTRTGHADVRLVPVKITPLSEHRRRVLEEVLTSKEGVVTPGPSAARSQDFLYDDDGMPG